MPERIALVTGAHGFLGRYVAQALAEQGWSVQGLGHGTWARPEWARYGIGAWHTCDVTLENLMTYAHDPALVVHCAGGASVPFSVAQPLLDYRRTVDTTVAALEFVRQRAPGAAFVFPSSGSVYGSSATEALREDAPAHPESPYAVHKLVAEGLCASYGRFFAVRTAAVRFFSVYGPGLRKQLLWDACGRLSRGDPVFAGTGREERDWLHVEDAARLVVHAEAHAATTATVVNGGTGIATSVREVVEALAEDLGRPAPATFSGERRSGDPFRFVADNALARSWGWAPLVRWREGMRQYAEWYTRGTP